MERAGVERRARRAKQPRRLALVAAAHGGLRALRHHGCLSGAIPAVRHSLAGAFLGLLVTFRTNSAYARFWEARIIWGGIMNTCRSLAINAKVWISPRSPGAARRFCAGWCRSATRSRALPAYGSPACDRCENKTSVFPVF